MSHIEEPDWICSNTSNHQRHYVDEEEQAMSCQYFRRKSHYVCDGCNLAEACCNASNHVEYV